MHPAARGCSSVRTGEGKMRTSRDPVSILLSNLEPFTGKRESNPWVMSP